jgi:hypothetical protein
MKIIPALFYGKPVLTYLAGGKFDPEKYVVRIYGNKKVWSKDPGPASGPEGGSGFDSTPASGPASGS